MKTKMILPATLALVLASATGAFAQQMQYDRTGDHMNSYGAQTVTAAPKAHLEHHQAAPHMMVTPSVQYDRTGDHMNSYSPVAQ
jgi:hypothetical protein